MRPARPAFKENPRAAPPGPTREQTPAEPGPPLLEKADERSREAPRLV